MLRLGKRSRKTPDQVIEAAARYFAGKGIGLTVTRRAGSEIRLEGGGGEVTVTATAEGAGSRHCEVDIVSREWDSAARQFLRKI